MDYDYESLRTTEEEQTADLKFYRDYSNILEVLPEIKSGYKDSISATLARWIRQKVYGRDVRESMAQFVEWISVLTNRSIDKVDDNAKRQTIIEGRQKIVEDGVDKFKDEFNRKYNEQIAGNTDLDEVIDARMDESGIIHVTLKERLAAMGKQTDGKINQTGVNLSSLGLKLDGVTDEGALVNQYLTEYSHVIIPDGGMLATSVPIVVRQGMSLVGSNPATRGYKNSSGIKWIGERNDRETVVQIGRNRVGDEPTQDTSNAIVKNLFIECDYKVGFGIYGTYLTNDTLVENITVQHTTEYGMYFAKAWYATFRDLRALNNKGCGIAFGMPLQYQDGSEVVFTSGFALEINNCLTDNIRSNFAGEFYSVDNQGTWKPTDASTRRKGYGIGAGIGNGFLLTNFLAENSGGVNLYVLTDSQPSKTIRQGYLEKTNLNSGLDASSTMTNIIIENLSKVGGPFEISNIFANYHSGGIYHIGEDRNVWLRNVHQPRFLKSLDGRSILELYAIVLKSNVYNGAGYYNTALHLTSGLNAKEKVNTRSSFTVTLDDTPTYKLIFVRSHGTAPQGSLVINNADGSTKSVGYPSGLGNDFVLATVANPHAVSITRGGAASNTDSDVTIRVYDTPFTYI